MYGLQEYVKASLMFIINIPSCVFHFDFFFENNGYFNSLKIEHYQKELKALKCKPSALSI